MRLLLVGASGFIGRHLLGPGRGAGWTVYGTAREGAPGATVRFDLARDRIADAAPQEFLRAGAHRAAVVCAGVTGSERCRLEPAATRSVNVDGTLRLVRDLGARGIPCVYLSSDAVFDGRRGGYTEEDPPAPLTEYGRQKLMAEQGVLALSPSNLVLRLGKVVGGVPGEPHLFTEWLASAQAGRRVRCIRGQVLAPTGVEDVAAGVVAALRLGLAGLFHLSAAELWPRVELARRFFALIGQPADVVEEDAAAFGFAEERPLRGWLDGGRFAARTGLGFAAMTEVIAAFAARRPVVRCVR